jgi:hypothetical protein
VFGFSRPPEFIWCSWESLAQQIDSTPVSSTAPIHVYAFEDLVAYHLWFALNQHASPTINVSVIKGLPGVQEDPAYFMPRGFSDIPIQRDHYLTGDNTWIAFRASEWDDSRSPLNLFRQNGFEVEQVFSRKAQGQQAFLVKLRRQDKPK